MIDLNGLGHYLGDGWLQISVANLVTTVLMFLIFATALVVPFPRGRDATKASHGQESQRSTESGTQS
jgi:hypothetical protein